MKERPVPRVREAEGQGPRQLEREEVVVGAVEEPEPQAGLRELVRGQLHPSHR